MNAQTMNTQTKTQTNTELIFIRDYIMSFFKHANLGPCDPQFHERDPLNSILALCQNGLTNRESLTDLFEIYSIVNNMKRDDNYFESTTQMDMYFQPIYDQLIDFDPKRFSHDRFADIINASILIEDEYNPGHIDMLTNKVNNNAAKRINREYSIISSLLGKYVNTF